MPRNNSSESRKSCNRGHWRPAEDEKLKQLVEQYGPQNWNFIAEHLDGRSGKSCRLRWYNQLDSNIVKRPFTELEEEMLLALQKVKGNKWAAISRYLPGRTDNAVKNHFHVLMARRKRDRFALFGGGGHRSIIHNNNNDDDDHHIPMLDSSTTYDKPNSEINFMFQNDRNMSTFGMSSSHHHFPIFDSSESLLSTLSSDLATNNNNHKNNTYKAHKNDSSASSHHGSCMLTSYNSFTAPGIPSIGKVVPLPQRFSNSNNYGGHRIEDFPIKCKKGKAPCDTSVGFSELPNMEGQVKKLKNTVSFIDFLGVGSSSKSS